MPAIHETPTSYRTFTEQATAPAAASPGEARLYVGDDKILRWRNSSGDIFAVGGLVPQDIASTSYTLDEADFFQLLRFTNAGAVTVTIPTDVSAGVHNGTSVWVRADGAGGVTVQGDGGVTVSGTTTIAEGQTVRYVAVAADTWESVDPPPAATDELHPFLLMGV